MKVRDFIGVLLTLKQDADIFLTLDTDLADIVGKLELRNAKETGYCLVAVSV